MPRSRAHPRPPAPVEPRAVSVDIAAAELGCSRHAVYEAVARGEIPAVRIGRRVLIRRATLERLLVEPGRAS